MKWEVYKSRFITTATSTSKHSKTTIDQLLNYAKGLYDNKLPIIYDQTHLSLLIGINNEYLHRMSNAPEYFYRTFFINKSNGKKRRIDEPSPDLKKVQSWILNEILYCVPCSRYAKAYIPGNSLKDNVRFHKRQSKVITIDLKDFFPSIKSGSVLNLFLSLGYNLNVAIMLTFLCTYKNSIPQGTPTSSYLSNLIMSDFDEIIGKYCVVHSYRYTRYADDMTFSGDIDVSELLLELDKELKKKKMIRNPKKFHVMNNGCRQIVTGIVTNEKTQLPRDYRMKIRQEVYYIDKFGLDSHMMYTQNDRSHYLRHLLGKIHYCLFINPSDSHMQKCLNIINKINETYNLKAVK